MYFRGKVYGLGVIGLSFLLVVGVIVVSVWAISFRSKPVVVIIDDRAWFSQAYVRYDESHYVYNAATETWQWETDTETRCRSDATGRELPVWYEEPGCRMLPGDYMSYSHQFTVKYHVQESEEQEHEYFLAHLWDLLEPGQERVIVTNILGTVVSVEE